MIRLFYAFLFCFTSVGITSVAIAQSVNPYETSYVFPLGSEKYAEQELDLNRFRPAFITSDAESENLVFENYIHDDKYWTASLSKNVDVSKIYVHVVRFQIVSGVTAAHVQLRAKFKEGNKITLQSGDELLKKNDIIISFEAGRPVDESYNFFTGMEDNYLLVGRIASGNQRLKEYGEGYFTEQYEVKLSDEEKTQLLINAIQRSHDNGLKFFYNTLKPNCTTEIFELIDALPSQKNSTAEPFLAFISNDPVAGPTIDALKERNLLVRRAADLGDEIDKGATEPPLVTKTDQEKSLELLPQIENTPYSIVIASPEELKGQIDLKEAQKTAYELAPKLVQALVSNLMANSVQGESPSVLRAFRKLGPFMKESLVELSKKFDDDQEVQMSLYFAPWKQDAGREIDVLKELEVPAKLPIKTFEISSNPEDFHELHAGLNDALYVHSVNQSSFGAMGMALHIYLSKENSNMSFQAIGHLGEFEKALTVKNDQVQISQFIVPDASSLYAQPTALLNLSQNINDELPSLNISFGPFGGLEEASGRLKLKTRSDKQRSYAVPSMKGSAAALSLIDVWLDVFAVDFDLESLSVSDIDVRVSSGIFGLKTGIFKNLESDPKVNAQFTDSINAQIKEQQAKIGLSPGLTLLEELLSNNKEDLLSGFE